MTDTQPSLFDELPPLDPATIQARFEEFHAANPWVFDKLEELVRDAIEHGATKLGIGMLWEVLRWQIMRATTGDPAYRLNNNHRSRYARLLIDVHPEWEELFEVRRIRTT